MRAKEYIEENGAALCHLAEVRQVIADLMPLRRDKQQTDEYFNRRLSADIRRREYLFRMELFEQGNALQKQRPVLEEIDGEIPAEISAEVREELFHVIQRDESFGYLFFLLGTEQNAKRKHNPIDCLPDERRISEAISRYRDDYPKQRLDDYLNDEMNYQQYDRITTIGHFEEDEQMLLDYFNRTFEVYDQLRLSKQSISTVRNLLRNLDFADDRRRYWTLDFIVHLIDTYETDDAALDRLRKEIERVMAPLRPSVLGDEQFESASRSPIYLNPKKGTKLDFIRIVNCFYELGGFVDANGGKLTKKTMFTAIGNAVNVDLSAYDKDLSRSLSDSTALEKHLRIFDELRDKMEEIFNSK